jgi:hypothetical protein
VTRHTPPTLESRIAGALGNVNCGSGELGELITETELSLVQAEATVDQQKARAIDMTKTPDVRGVVEEITTSELLRDRLKTVLPRLRDKLRVSLVTESEARWTAKAQRVEADADLLADEFSTAYAEHVTALLDLFQRMAASDREVRALNIDAPSGARHLRTAEQIARGLDGGFSTSTPSIIAQVQLTDHLGRVIWPVPKPVFSTTVPIPIVPHPGPQWSEALAAEAEAKRREAERVASDYDHRAREQAEKEAIALG